MCPTPSRPHQRKLTQWIPADLDDLIVARAKKMRATKSEVVRDLLMEGLIGVNAAEVEERLMGVAAEIRAIVTGADPQTARLIDFLLLVLLETNALARLGRSEQDINRAIAYATKNFEEYNRRAKA